MARGILTRWGGSRGMSKLPSWQEGKASIKRKRVCQNGENPTLFKVVLSVNMQVENKKCVDTSCHGSVSRVLCDLIIYNASDATTLENTVHRAVAHT